MGGAEFPLSYRATFNSRQIEFAGYEYVREHSEVSGGLMTHYDESKPKTWKVRIS